MSLLSNRTEPATVHPARAVQDVAAYLDDVVVALADAGIRTDSIEIDARRPLTGRLTVTGTGRPETPVLEWRRDNGWWLAWRARLDARPTGWQMLSGDPDADPADVAGQFRHDLHDIRPGQR